MTIKWLTLHGSQLTIPATGSSTAWQAYGETLTLTEAVATDMRCVDTHRN
jgi:hypothetical protein